MSGLSKLSKVGDLCIHPWGQLPKKGVDYLDLFISREGQKHQLGLQGSSTHDIFDGSDIIHLEKSQLLIEFGHLQGSFQAVIKVDEL